MTDDVIDAIETDEFLDEEANFQDDLTLIEAWRL